MAKDKAIRRYSVRNLVEATALRDLSEASVYSEFVVPKTYQKNLYCISCAIHLRIVRPRAKEVRRNRDPPPRRVRAGGNGKLVAVGDKARSAVAAALM